MQFKPLPDPSDRGVLKDYLWGRQTIVVHDRASRAAYSRHVAPLSMKAVRSGSECYNVHGFEQIVTPGEYLVVNNGQPYESAIESDAPVETMCVFFSNEDVLDAERQSLADAALLDDPDVIGGKIEFSAVKRGLDAGLRTLIDAMPNLRGASALARQEFSARLLSSLMQIERSCWGGASKLSALRASTRFELLRRCMIGQAYIDAEFSRDITLTEMAKAAGLSRTHFLRSFAQCFGETPYQALRRRRLEEAMRLLKQRAGAVTDIALSVGYTDFSAFARAFRAVHGVAPSRACS